MKWDIRILKSGFSARHLHFPRKGEFSHGNKSVRDWWDNADHHMKTDKGGKIQWLCVTEFVAYCIVGYWVN